MAESVSDDTHEYSLLKDLRLQIGVEDSSFSLCFWIYLMNPTPFPATIIGQVLNYSVSCFLRCFSFFLSYFFFFLLLSIQYPFIHFFSCVFLRFSDVRPGCSAYGCWISFCGLVMEIVISFTVSVLFLVVETGKSFGSLRFQNVSEVH